MTKRTVAFHNFANASKKGTYSCFSMATIVTRTLNNVSSRNKITSYYVHCLPRFWSHSQNCEKRLLAFSCQSVRPSVRMERLGSYWTYFHEILYLSIFRKKNVEKIRVSLESNKNDGYSTRRPIQIFDNISLGSF